jgi:U2 small nuclear ribonucleoprotein A'
MLTCRTQERNLAKSLFVTEDKLPTPLADAIASAVTTNRVKAPIAIDEPRAVAGSRLAGRLMTDEDRAKVKLAIINAKSAEEVRRLEQQLLEGWIPS